MKRSRLLILSTLALLLVFPAIASAESPIEGRWATPEREATIEIFERDGAYFGKLVASKHKKAPIGTLILRELRPKDGGWEGRIYVVKKDKILPARVERDKARLKIKVSAGWFSKTVTWTRVK